MDMPSIVAPVASTILSIAAIAALISKYIVQARKYAHIAKDAVITLSDVIDSLEDGKLTPEEITQLIKDVESFKADLK